MPLGRVSTLPSFEEMLRGYTGSVEYPLIAGHVLSSIGERRPVIETSNVVEYDVRVLDDEVYGRVFEIIVYADARSALEFGVRMAEDLKGVPVTIKWTGETNVSDDELVGYLVKIALKSGVKAKALPGFNAVKAVREDREE